MSDSEQRDTIDFEPMAPEAGDEVGLAPEWAVPWSDLMMVMFVLFVVLFAYHMAEREIRTELGGDPELPAFIREPSLETLPPEGLYRRSLEAIREAQLEDVEVVLEKNRSVRLSATGPMFFDLGRAELRPETMEFLDRVAAILQRTPNEVHVVGHTDDFPISSPAFPTNWELSAARAASVTRYLVRRGGLAPERFTVMGHSMYRPAASNASLKDKALNRRVEIVITTRPYGVTDGEDR